MIYIISNGEYPSDHTLYFVKATPGYDFRAWFKDFVDVDDDGYRKFEDYEIVGVIKGSLELEHASYELNFYTAKEFREYISRNISCRPPIVNEPMYAIAKSGVISDVED